MRICEIITEATGDKRFDDLMARAAKEPTPDAPKPSSHGTRANQENPPEMPPTNVQELYTWAVQNHKPDHKLFAEWANREGYKNVNDALGRAGRLDSEYLDYWTPEAYQMWFGEPMPKSRSKDRVSEEFANYIADVFNAYENIWDDWGDDYRQMRLK